MNFEVGAWYVRQGDPKHCNNGDVMFLISHVTSHDHLLNGSYTFYC